MTSPYGKDPLQRKRPLYIGVSDGIFPFSTGVELTGDELSTLLSFVDPDRIHVSETSTCQPGLDWKQRTCEWMLVPDEAFGTSDVSSTSVPTNPSIATRSSIPTISARRFFDEYLTRQEQKKLMDLVHTRLNDDSGWQPLKMFQGMPLVLTERNLQTNETQIETISSKARLRNRMAWAAVDQDNPSFLAALYNDEIPFDELVRDWIRLEQQQSSASIIPVDFKRI